MPQEERNFRDQQLMQNFFALQEVKKARNFFIYVSYGTEADTMGILSALLRRGRMVAAPRVEGEEMDFYEIHHPGELHPGYQGILEPAGSHPVRAENGIMLMPGLAFDRHGNRLGYGGGYYDRYLADQCGDGLVTVALAYDFQVAESLPVDAFDRRADIVVTDRQVF